MRIKRLYTPIRAKILKMSDLSIQTYFERHGVEISQHDTLEALQALLSAQPYNPILWKLYATCQFLYAQSPPSFTRREVRIDDYVCEEVRWISGDTDEICDVILVDDSDKKPDNEGNVEYVKDIAYATINAEFPFFYIIPVEWIPHIVVRSGRFYLLPFKFCCRQVLCQSNVAMVRCQSMNIEDFYLVDKTFFHVGCGSCTVKSSESVFIFASLPVYLGIRNVMLMMEKYSFLNAGEMIFALSSNKTKLKYHNVDDDEAVYLKGNHVRMYFSHIIICKFCYRYLYDFLNLLNEAVAITRFK